MRVISSMALTDYSIMTRNDHSGGVLERVHVTPPVDQPGVRGRRGVRLAGRQRRQPVGYVGSRDISGQRVVVWGECVVVVVLVLRGLGTLVFPSARVNRWARRW